MAMFDATPADLAVASHKKENEKKIEEMADQQ